MTGERSPSSPEVDAGGLHVLIVDDEPDMRDYIRRCLEREDGVAFVTTTGDGLYALELIERQPADLVVCDVVMAGLDGIELCRSLRAAPATSDVPVLFVTGEGRSFLPADLPGPVAFLRKPFNARRLCDRVRRLLQDAS